MTAVDLTAAPTEAFEARVAAIEAAPHAPESWEEPDDGNPDLIEAMREGHCAAIRALCAPVPANPPPSGIPGTPGRATDVIGEMGGSCCAETLEAAAEAWAADPDAVGDSDKDARNWLRDRADALRLGI